MLGKLAVVPVPAKLAGRLLARLGGMLRLDMLRLSRRPPDRVVVALVGAKVDMGFSCREGVEVVEPTEENIVGLAEERT
jgi:hypothetical protein